MVIFFLFAFDTALRQTHAGFVRKPKHTADSAPEKKTPGTVMAEQVRARANALSDVERESLMAYAMSTIYSGKSDAVAHADRR